jgi:hypothetical protein
MIFPTLIFRKVGNNLPPPRHDTALCSKHTLIVVQGFLKLMYVSTFVRILQLKWRGHVVRTVVNSSQRLVTKPLGSCKIGSLEGDWRI